MNGNITKLTELKKLRSGHTAQYRIRIDQNNASLLGAQLRLSYRFGEDGLVNNTAQQVMGEANQQVFNFELDVPDIEQATRVTIELELSQMQNNNRIQLEQNTPVYCSNEHNVLMYADFLRAPVYFAIAQSLLEKGVAVTVIVNDDSTVEQFIDYTKPIPQVLVGEPEFASSFRNIDLFVSDDMNVRFGPKGAERACIPHSLAERPDLLYVRSGLPMQHAMLTTDHFFMITPEQQNFTALAEALHKHYPLELTQLRSKQLGFVPVGYPKIALLKQKLQAYPDRSAILFAPSSRALSGISTERTKAICLSLVQAFPNNEVIYRPYPSAKEGEGIEHLVQTLSQYPNFTFDFSKSSVEAIQRTKYVFTDESSLAISFSLATATPHFKVSIEDNASSSGIRQGAGWVEIEKLEQIATSISQVEAEAEFWAEQMKHYEGEFAYDIDCVFDNITQAISDILSKGNAANETLVARSFSDLSDLNAAQLVEHILAQPYMWVEWQIRPLMTNYLHSRFGQQSNELVALLNERITNDILPNPSMTEQELDKILHS